MTDIKIQKPFLKWVGGKTQIMPHVLKRFPSSINNYHELFLGGGSVLLATLSLQRQKKLTIENKIYAYDVNQALINVYIQLQQNKDALFEYTELYINEYDGIETTDGVANRKHLTMEEGMSSKESYYYWKRKLYNDMDKTTIECAALFMFINKTCFRGMYREGPNGYNIPYGHYKKTPTIISRVDLDNISDLIKDVVFVCGDFGESIKNAGPGDFVYLDPPYAPENEKSFVGYVQGGFNLDTHKRLFDGVKELNKQQIQFAMSNARVQLVVDNFASFNSDEIVARRAINSKNPGSKAMEVIIYN